MSVSLRPQLRVLHRRVLVGRARDITADSAARSALVLAPHPDDETIGCGATIARKVARGTPVHVVIATDSDDAGRRDECAEACRRLGLSPGALQFLGLPDGVLDAHPHELDAALRAGGRALPPRRPASRRSPSTRTRTTERSPRPSSACAQTNCATRPVLSYPVWFWNRWAWVDRSTPRRTQDAELVWRPLAATFSLQPARRAHRRLPRAQAATRSRRTRARPSTPPGSRCSSARRNCSSRRGRCDRTRDGRRAHVRRARRRSRTAWPRSARRPTRSTRSSSSTTRAPNRSTTSSRPLRARPCCVFPTTAARQAATPKDSARSSSRTRRGRG